MKIGRFVRKYNACICVSIYKVVCASRWKSISTLSLSPDFDISLHASYCVSIIHLTLLQLYAYHNYFVTYPLNIFDTDLPSVMFTRYELREVDDIKI